MRKGDRLYVRDVLFEGWATVIEYFPREQFFPIAIELDEPDGDGHSYKRIGRDDIVRNKKGE